MLSLSSTPTQSQCVLLLQTNINKVVFMKSVTRTGGVTSGFCISWRTGSSAACKVRETSLTGTRSLPQTSDSRQKGLWRMKNMLKHQSGRKGKEMWGELGGTGWYRPACRICIPWGNALSAFLWQETGTKPHWHFVRFYLRLQFDKTLIFLVPTHVLLNFMSWCCLCSIISITPWCNSKWMSHADMKMKCSQITEEGRLKDPHCQTVYLKICKKKQVWTLQSDRKLCTMLWLLAELKVRYGGCGNP